MEDIIKLLQHVYRGMDRISVCGLENQDMLLSCAKGVHSAITGLEAILEAKEDAKTEVPEAEELEEKEDGNVC